MTKYKRYFNKMLTDEKVVFEKFRILHDKYALDENKWQEEYNREGERVLEIIREYENRLCANTERGMYNKFSTGLAEKFQNEVRKAFPMIDHVGIKITYEEPAISNESSPQNPFTLKKINLL